MTVQHYMSHCNVKFWMNNPCQFINFWVTHKSDIIGENGPPMNQPGSAILVDFEITGRPEPQSDEAL